METTPINELTELIIACAIAVHDALGPGLLESIYQDCLRIELMSRGLTVECERRVPIVYKGQRVRDDLRIDLIVNGRVIIEIKAVDRLHPVFQAQVISYLKLTGCEAGLLLNFNALSIRAGMKRLDHPDVYKQRTGRIQRKTK